MTELTKEILEKYQIRKTKAQKNAFISFLQEKVGKMGYASKLEAGRRGSCNIVVGDVDNAKVVYTAHYDTCPVLPFPNFITPKNFLIYLLYQILLSAAILAVAYGSQILIDKAALLLKFNGNIAYFLELAVFYGIICLLFLGPANKHTANDNTSGVTTLLEIMANLPDEKKNEVAFVFFDLEEMGLVGSSSFAQKHKKVMKEKLLINFDCVSDGDHILLVLRKKSKAYKDALEKAYVSNELFNVEVADKGVFYPSDQMNFVCGVGVAALKKSKFINLLYMDRIHTKKDTVYTEENIEFLTKSSITLLNYI